MSTNTTNLSLVKQTGSEYYSIDVVNTNLDKIDAGCVNVSGTQTITGVKTFTSDIKMASANDKRASVDQPRLNMKSVKSSIQLV